MKHSRNKEVAVLQSALWHWQLLAPAFFFAEREHNIYWTGGWVRTIAGLDVFEKKEELFILPRICQWFHSWPGRILVTIMTELPRLLYTFPHIAFCLETVWYFCVNLEVLCHGCEAYLEGGGSIFVWNVSKFVPECTTSQKTSMFKYFFCIFSPQGQVSVLLSGDCVLWTSPLPISFPPLLLQ
jgi:hypothetical protein